MPVPHVGPPDRPPATGRGWPLRAVDFAQAALVAGFAAVLWDELVLRSATVFSEDTAYRFGFLFVAVLLLKRAWRRRGTEADATPDSADAAPGAPPPVSPKDPAP